MKQNHTFWKQLPLICVLTSFGLMVVGFIPMYFGMRFVSSYKQNHVYTGTLEIEVEHSVGKSSPAVISNVIGDGPAWVNGIRKGDELISVDEVKTEGLSDHQMFDLLNIDKGRKSSKLVVREKATGALREFDIPWWPLSGECITARRKRCKAYKKEYYRIHPEAEKSQVSKQAKWPSEGCRDSRARPSHQGN